MNRIRGLLCIMLATGALLAAAGGKEIIVAAGETRTSPINAFRSRLDIQGRVDESVFLVGGRLDLAGEVSGDVICIAAQVTIGGRAVIGKDLIVIGGRLERADGSRIGGELYHVRTQKDLKKIAATVLPFLPEAGGLTFFKIIKIFFWLILTLLTLLILPAQVAGAAARLGEAPLRHLLRGLLALLVFVLLLLLCLLLSIVLIGIPLLILLIAAYFLLLVFGRAAVFFLLGCRIAAALKLKISAALFIVMGVAVYTLLKFLPFPGSLLLIVMDLFAMGSAAGMFLQRRKAIT